LGTIPEGVFYQTPLQAYEPELGETVYFEVIAGELPAGMQISANGMIDGIPKAIASVQGVPADVSNDVVSKFAVRAYTQATINGITVINRLADRTFTLTVAGQDAPEFITPPGTIGTYYDGSQITDLQVQYTDTDPADNVIVRLAAGILPPGLTINTRGLISGFLIPNSTVEATAGFSRDGQGWDEYPFDFSTRSSNVNYEFVLEVTDGKASNLRTFSIYVYSRSSMTADNTDITADNTFITADVSPVRTPILLNTPGSIGSVRNDNFFAYKFNGLDLDGDQITYSIITSPGVGYDSSPFDTSGFSQGVFELPPGITLDSGTGWLYGYIPDLGITDITYPFAIQVYKTDDPAVISDFYYFSLTVTGAIDTEVIWLTDSDLGTIINGETSILYVAAINTGGIPLLYRLQSGSDSSLPQGLQLLESGEIAGRVSFNTFALDLGTTSFDSDTTTFDLEFTFTVNAYSADGLISVFKTFTINLIRAFNEPYENLYIQAMPPQNDRDLISNLIQDSEIFPPGLIYRYNDPNFGVAKNVVYEHAYGLTASTIADYYASLNINHYWKDLVLGSIETAQALDDNGNVIYEVVYSRVVDNLVNSQGESVDKDVLLPFPINPGDSTEINTVYPNSLINMRDQVIDTVGQISNILPRWMLSKQVNGQVLGFTPAWVIAYTQPGKSGQIKYNIETIFGTQLNSIDFEVDRYELDRLLTHNWDPIADSTHGAWEPTPAETTFDRIPGPETVFDGGSVKFIAPVDMYSDTTDYDKYLVFPKRTILG
jgi:hypothetical protein